MRSTTKVMSCVNSCDESQALRPFASVDALSKESRPLPRSPARLLAALRKVRTESLSGETHPATRTFIKTSTRVEVLDKVSPELVLATASVSTRTHVRAVHVDERGIEVAQEFSFPVDGSALCVATWTGPVWVYLFQVSPV